MSKKTEVLIVENERITAQAIHDTLISMNYSISSTVSTADAAIKEALENKPDVILMDVKLRGEIDGIQTAKMIRDKIDIPIIFTTALTDNHTLERAKTTDPYGYLHKPIDEKELYTIIEMALFRHQMERKLKVSEERYRSIFEGSRDAIFISGEDSHFVQVNEAASILTGYSKKELLGMSITGLHESRDLHAYRLFSHRVMSGEQITSEAKILRKDGIKIDTEFSNRRIEIGAISYMHTVARDITERKRTEEDKELLQAQLIHAEKMAGIGTLTSGVAHEFNNLLQIIKGHMEFALKTKRQEDIEDAFLTGISSSDRAAKIIKDLLMFSREEISGIERASITGPLEASLSLFEENMKKHNIEVVKNYSDTSEIEMNSAEIQQVFFNIISNARDAMRTEGGKLEINVRQAKEKIEVSFKDSGSGIEEENLARVFEPFYTTKGAMGGSKIPGIGLGMSVSYGIVRRHGGTIKLKSKAGRGSTFTVSLPMTGSEGMRRIPVDLEPKMRNKKGALNILAVDDEEEIGRMISKWLSSEGHNVKFVLSGRKAVDLVETEFFDYVLLDIVMPGIPAFEVLEKIKELSLDTAVIMMTGKSIDPDMLYEFVRRGASGFLQKPFTIKDINSILKG